MRLIDVERVNIIDNNIVELHGELQQLYSERSALTSSKPAAISKNSSNTITSINLDDIDLSLDD